MLRRLRRNEAYNSYTDNPSITRVSTWPLQARLTKGMHTGDLDIAGGALHASDVYSVQLSFARYVPMYLKLE